MQEAEARRAVVVAMSTASELDLAVDDAVVLNDSNRLVVRLTPCDIVARVTPMTHFASAEREVELATRLAENGSPVAGLEPSHASSCVTAMWTYFEPVRRALPPAEYAQALGRPHAGFRQVDVTTPHIMDRVAATQRDVASRGVTPDLAETDRALLADTVCDLRESIVDRRAAEQVLHGELHPWNVLDRLRGTCNSLAYDDHAVGLRTRGRGAWPARALGDDPDKESSPRQFLILNHHDSLESGPCALRSNTSSRPQRRCSRDSSRPRRRSRFL